MNYLEQLEKAVIFIENNLHEDLKTYEVAGAAGYSCYHFHRIFEAVLGETVGNYIRSRRLCRAAGDLLYTDKRILDIAVYYQFDSQEAFNRAFKKAYKVSPGVYRKNRIDAIVGSKKELSPLRLKHLSEGMTIQPVLKEIDPVMLVGLRGRSSLSDNKLFAMWQTFNTRVSEIQNLAAGQRGFGVCEADPGFDLSLFDESTESSHFIGAEVTSIAEVPEGMEMKVLNGGRYAVFTHKGRLDTLSMTYEYIWGTWVLCSGYEIDLRDDFEFYDERFLGPDQDASEFDIYLPIK
jgi:AraC family transcriptional regulator